MILLQKSSVLWAGSRRLCLHLPPVVKPVLLSFAGLISRRSPMPKINKKVMLLQGEPHNAAVNFIYQILQSISR